MTTFPLTYDPGMLRISWLVLVVILLKLGVGMASPVQVLQAQSAHLTTLSDCHTPVMAHEDPASAELTTPHQDKMPDTGCGSESCHLCCAFDASNMRMLASQAPPTAAPQWFTAPWNSVSPPVVLRPPIA